MRFGHADAQQLDEDAQTDQELTEQALQSGTPLQSSLTQTTTSAEPSNTDKDGQDDDDEEVDEDGDDNDATTDPTGTAASTSAAPMDASSKRRKKQSKTPDAKRKRGPEGLADKINGDPGQAKTDMEFRCLENGMDATFAGFVPDNIKACFMRCACGDIQEFPIPVPPSDITYHLNTAKHKKGLATRRAAQTTIPMPKLLERWVMKANDLQAEREAAEQAAATQPALAAQQSSVTPSSQPTALPSSQPTAPPSSQPTAPPSSQLTAPPTTQPAASQSSSQSTSSSTSSQ